MALIHRWTLREDASDMVGSLNLVQSGSGSSLVSFDHDNCAYFPSAKALTGTLTLPDSFSFSLWVKPTDFVSRQMFMGTCNSSGLNYTGFDCLINDDSLCFLVNANAISQGAIGNKYNQTNYPSNKFTHIVGTYNGTNINIYYNGDSISSAVRAKQTALDTNFALGKHGSSPYGFFTGWLADARIYDHILNPIEVKNIFNSGVNGDLNKKFFTYLI